MSYARFLLCPACKDSLDLHPADRRNGFQQRRVEIAEARRPPGLARQSRTITDGHVEIVREDVPVLKCDACYADIPDGTPATAVTHWRGPVTPDPWEKEYESTDR